MENARVQVQNVSLSYGTTHVLRDVSLAIEPGEFFALLGPSGSGKSTLLRLIAGFNQAQSGRVLVGGRDVTNVPPWKRNIGMVFQNYALWPHMTVERNVAFGLEERRLPREEIRVKSHAALELVGLSGFLDRYPSQLSGGQQQRVALARTLAIEPQVLLLDEPLSNLDARLRVQMRRELRRLHENLGITTIFVTHDQEEAMTMCDRIAVLDEGVVQQVGTPLELFDKPANRFVAQFVGSVNLVEGAVRNEDGVLAFVSPALGSWRLPAGMASGEAARAHIAFRPHAVRLQDEGGSVPGALELQGVVTGGEFLGEFMRYDIAVAGTAIVADQPHLRQSRPLAKGEAARLLVPAEEIRLIET